MSLQVIDHDDRLPLILYVQLHDNKHSQKDANKNPKVQSPTERPSITALRGVERGVGSDKKQW